ncbi:nucleotidyltransferase domain-containing protein [Verminephrobacter aporrectodeae]|uniref:nucleotidyltransferase domain-containing protein n=1 Tax=Verminephrobacter aporrectodeae TaxID=1110389 RepID=UPI002237B4DD|nr:nucleotidyltransferase [Verminephrobacter aporrectodeae]
MAIPETQLETWSHQGSIMQSSQTYNLIKDVLEASKTPYAGKKFKVFLQGSYGNATNIYAESDVDIVICLSDCFQSDLSNLSEAEKAAYKKAFVDATYTHVNFKQDVLSVLTNQYGSAVIKGNKAIAITASNSRRKVDVIVAIESRRYFKFNSPGDSQYAKGICFRNTAGEIIVNYPQQHSENMTAKHHQVSSQFKPIVRVFKNMRSRLVSDRLIERDVAPSYYIEGLLYNVPIDKFTPNYQDCVVNVLNWYRSEAKNNNLICANAQYDLLKCWPQANCDAFIDATVSLWGNWSM